MALSEKDNALVWTLTSAKETWDGLTDLFIGNESIHESKYDEANNEAENFAMFDGEDPQELYRRLSALQVKLTNLGDTHCDWRWMKKEVCSSNLALHEGNNELDQVGAGYRK
jgi:hypothetical protein